MEATIAFKCPACKSDFEFDPIGENELVSCPICGNDFKTVKKGKHLSLEYLNFETASKGNLKIPFFLLKSNC
jgi:Zn finger protein HypA/HybF involved in hydrogenase expression